MVQLFDKANIDYKPLVSYISWFVDPDSENFNLIQLPPIQRNAVWYSNQIEKLWDSLLRGFPIGGFLLSVRNEGQNARDFIQGEQTKSERKGYFLLDGQQRTRSLMLGFRPTSESRLWVDLNPSLSFGNPEFNDRRFLFRLITKYQPWGMNDRNPVERLNENEKYDARFELHNKSVRYDYNVRINDSPDGLDLGEKFSWPVKASVPVPFDALVRLCGGVSGNFIAPQWNDVLAIIPDRYKHNGPLTPTVNYGEILSSLEGLLNTAEEKGNITAVVFLKQNLEVKTGSLDEKAQDSMEVLFRRINSNGTQLVGEEMSYSLLKSSWDESYNLVSGIVNDKEIGYLFSSTGVVMAAARIARFSLGSGDDPQPNGADFRRWLGEKYENGTSPFLEKMKMLIDQNRERTSFHSLLERFCCIALYRYEQDDNDPGIPRKLLLSIKPSLIHPVLIWLYKSDPDPLSDRRNRHAILRYLIFCLIGISSQNKDKASKKAVEIIRNSDGNFPDKAIYRSWLDEEWVVRIPNIRQFGNTLDSPVTGLLREWHEVMGNEDDPYRDFRSNFWGNRELLLWFQRKYHAKWFQGYNPMSQDAYDTPYDFDHILAKSHLITSGGNFSYYIHDKAEESKFYNSRSLYINSIGNIRAWPSWANRSDNNICHTEKLKFNGNDFESDETSIELGLKSNDDFLIASSIAVKDVGLWRQAKGKPRDWPEIRRKAWQQAVESRVMYLYNIFYSELKFDRWTVESEMP